MSVKYREHKGLNLPNVAKEVLEKWKRENTFEESVTTRDENKPFVFFEGPPSANGMPGIHHVMGRAIKDIFCRYKTLKGYRVERKAGWDTHGLPVELSVEKELGITKEDIGTKITIEEYNAACKKTVMKYTDVWNKLTEEMGYWVDMSDPYITYENKYIESVWWLLKEIYNKDLMYKGYTIQPYSPKAVTGLSSHEINQPGCYQDVTDTTVTAQFKAKANDVLPENTYFLAWTTTPWTLPSNTALCVGAKIEYVLIKTFNQYTGDSVNLVLAKALIGKQLSGKYMPADEELTMKGFSLGDKKIPYLVEKEFVGSDLVGITYEQLLPYALPHENLEKAFQVISGNFVTTEDGTGIVHIAPTFGQDDAQVAKDFGIPPMLVLDENENPVPLINLQGKFRPEMDEFAGLYVKNEYYNDGDAPDKSVDVLIAIKLKEENKAFKVEKYVHSYPHCWRTDKPILYYPLDSWFIKISEVKGRMAEINKTINWKPKATGEGRFGNWLEGANDWNLSRSRFWGIPIPIWRTEDGTEQMCIGSAEELKNECQKAVEAGLMDENPLAAFEVGNMDKANYESFDFHKNYVDNIILVSPAGKPMIREADLIDVWFDSGSMPIAQRHYPFENKELVDGKGFGQADFIAEGVDQTRGWFYTLHAIASIVFDRSAYKNVVSNGLVLDKNGVKMSKRLGNAVEPFENLATYGADATRWYMITNAQPWDNLKFDLDGITEVQRKFFGTLYNTYGFFSLYANVDGFSFSEEEIPLNNRPEIDRWVISKLNSLIQDVEEAYESYEPTKAGRLIQGFVSDQMSNWYVRLCRRRYWRGDYTEDKIAAYQTLYTCLETVSILSSPIAPFYSDQLFNDLNQVSKRHSQRSVHLTNFPVVDENAIDKDLEERMSIAQKVSSMVLSLRKKENIKVRQPLQKIMLPVLDQDFARRIEAVKDLILSEVNVKELQLIEDTAGVLVKKIKPNFKTIGKKYGKHMKAIIAITNQWSQDDIIAVDKNKGWTGEIQGESIVLETSDFEISTDDIPGWIVATEGNYTVALDETISRALKNEGIAREFVNRIQNLRKESGLEVTDRIELKIKSDDKINLAINDNLNYICSETLANSLDLVEEVKGEKLVFEVEEGVSTELALSKV